MRPTKYLLSLALTSLLTACGPTPEWRAGSPVQVEVDPDLPISTDVARQAVADRLGQFGIPVGSTGTRSIRVSFGADAPGCSTRVPGAVVAAYTSDRIWVCSGIKETTAKTPRGPYLVVSHEVGHVLGLVGHLPAGGNLMAPILDNYKDLSGFGPADLAAICSAGHVDSPAC